MKLFSTVIASVALLWNVSSASIIALSNTSANPGDTAVLITVTLDNDVPYAGSELTLQYNSTMLSLNRIEPAPRLQNQSETAFNEFTFGSVSLIVFDIGGESLPADSGDILNIYFDISPDTAEGIAQISLPEVTAVSNELEYDSLYVVDGWIRIPVGANCSYVIGDYNGNELFNVADIVASFSRLQTGVPDPAYTCECPQGSGNEWAVAMDVNNSCGFNVADVIAGFSYLQTGWPELIPCEDCPPPELVPTPGEYEIKPTVIPKLDSRAKKQKRQSRD